MPSTSIDFRRAIRFAGCNHSPLCHGYRWRIEDEDALARLVSWTMQGHYRHAEHVLNSLDVVNVAHLPTAQQQAIQGLALPPGTKNTAPRWHRDGLVFQHIAWLAAIIEGRAKIAASMPHLIPAHKGFDALLVPIDDSGAAKAGIIICEDKATTNPRNQITQQVWPSIDSVEAGERDAELTAELTTILRQYQIPNIDEILAETYWAGHKAYRVSITVSPQHDEDVARRGIFKGYDGRAPGEMMRRKADSIVLENLREWMDQFCNRVVAMIQNN